MNKNKGIIFIFLILLIKAESQNFGSLPVLDNTIFPYYAEKILFDSVHDKLIVSSKYMKYAGGKVVRGIATWNGTVWDSMSSGINTHDNLNFDPNGTVLSCIPYNGKLLVGGIFESIGGVKATSLALWDGIKFDSLPVRAFKFLDYGGQVYNFFKFNNSLYLLGAFDTIQGQKANGFAIYNGLIFQPIALPIESQATILCALVYNNEMYVGGAFTYSNTSGTSGCILKYNGTLWTSVGGGIKGSWRSIATMAVYNNYLYVAGYFEKSAGNLGNVIMKWDGNNWSDAGWGNTLDNGGIWKLLVHHNKLYAFGTSEFASDMYAPRGAVFDGNQWCAFKDSINEGVVSAAVYHDTIYIAGAFKKINSDTTKRYVAKLKNENLYSNCVPVGIIMHGSFNNGEIMLYPNPAQNNLTVKLDGFKEKTYFYLYNTIGQLVKSGSLIATINSIDLSNLSQGMYILEVKDQTRKATTKFIKNE